jgi:prepilin-type N-terminal cleavage/methylation domain-containing protein
MESSRFVSDRGVTLIELAVVIGIVSILGVIMIPNYLSTMPLRRLKADAMHIVFNMSYAKMNAVKMGENVGLYFNNSEETYNGIASNAYCVYIDDRISGTQNQFDSSDTVLKKNIHLRSGIRFDTFTCPNRSIIFSPNGSAVNSSGKVVITNGLDTRDIVADPITGLVQIQ